MPLARSTWSGTGDSRACGLYRNRARDRGSAHSMGAVPHARVAILNAAERFLLRAVARFYGTCAAILLFIESIAHAHY